jgi:membrane-associated phospholipid phosphatase
VYAFDQELFRAIHVGWRREWLDPVFTVFSYAGLSHVQLLLLLPLLARRETRKLFLGFALTLAISGLPLTHGFKAFIYRQRPSNLALASPQEPHLFSSFPSGHTTTSFALAFFAVLVFRGTRWAWIGWLTLGYASLVGLSRIYRGVHWPSDVLGGIAAGALAAGLVYLLFPPLRSLDSPPG